MCLLHERWAVHASLISRLCPEAARQGERGAAGGVPGPREPRLPHRLLHERERHARRQRVGGRTHLLLGSGGSKRCV